MSYVGCQSGGGLGRLALVGAATWPSRGRSKPIMAPHPGLTIRVRLQGLTICISVMRRCIRVSRWEGSQDVMGSENFGEFWVTEFGDFVQKDDVSNSPFGFPSEEREHSCSKSACDLPTVHMFQYRRIKKPPDPFPVASTVHSQSPTANFQSFQCFPFCFANVPSYVPKTDPVVTPLKPHSLVVLWLATTSKGVYDYALDLPSSPSSLHTSGERDTLIEAWRISADSTPTDNYDDCPNVVTLQIYDLASYGNSRTGMPHSPVTACFVPPLPLLRMFDVPPSQPPLPTADSKSSVPLHNANLLRSSQFPHDGPLPRSQLPTDLNRSSHNNPSEKDKEAIPTFSRAVKLRMGILSGGPVPRTRTERHVYPTSSNLEPSDKVTVSPKKQSRLPNAHRKQGILSAPSQFTAPKPLLLWFFLTLLLLGELVTDAGHNLDSAHQSSTSLETGISVYTGLSVFSHTLLEYYWTHFLLRKFGINQGSWFGQFAGDQCSWCISRLGFPLHYRPPPAVHSFVWCGLTFETSVLSALALHQWFWLLRTMMTSVGLSL
ncbi:hypothetical protein Cgig2_006320 [Carnegiea gigantea]|uniref:Uncharacterized protein n=1 Tax=Carnegiea gigantea TaxID=171969 RepID=A0A9Q1JM11_9CARY|nr:hypothetical protein Cgig2_006320 [Carnegiea gigantea]